MRKEQFVPGEYYHVYNRGVDKRAIFNDDYDKKRLQGLLYLANGDRNFELQKIDFKNIFEFDRGDKLVAIGTYSLIDNHFHILIKEINEGGISRFMHKLSTSYTMYFNIVNERTGCLFEGRYKAKRIDSDEYLRHIFAYIHLNPLKFVCNDWKERTEIDIKKLVSFLDNYQYSGYVDYLGVERKENVILSSDEFPAYFDHKYSIKDQIQDYLDFRGG